MEQERLVALVKRARQGDTDAVGSLHEGFRQDIYYFILKNVRNDSELAEDLTQDTFEEILRTISDLQEPAAFPGWARQIAYHRCTAYFRKRHELLMDENEDGQTIFNTVEEGRTEFIPDEALDKVELKRTVLAMVNDLPKDQREAIVLRYYNEISVKEIARIQGVPDNTVKSRLNYGRKMLRIAVEKYEKKNGVRLRCVGIVPLLLWLFRQVAVEKGVSVTTKAAVTGTAAALTASAGGTATGSTATSTVVTTAVKKAGKFSAKKIIAGIAAAAVVTGGAIAAIPRERDPVPEPRSMTWVGYGFAGVSYFNADRVEITMEIFEEDEVKGNLVCYALYEVFRDTDFTGTGETQEDGTILYTIILDVPYDTFLGDEIYEHTLIYDPKTETLAFRKYFDVVLERTDRIEEKMIADPGIWSGMGRDYVAHGTCGFTCERHRFVFEIQEATTLRIRGKLTVYDNGESVYETEFTGNGYQRYEDYEAKWSYEVDCEVPREKYDEPVDKFYLYYDLEKDEFSTDFFSDSYYYVTAQRED